MSPHTKPVTITTTTHALAVSIYALQATQGVLYLLDMAEAKAMTEWVGTMVADLWALALLAAGVIAFVATRMAADYPRPALRAEAVACAVLALASIWYEVTLVRGNGISEVVVTQSYAVMIAGGTAARVWQIRREQGKVRRAMEPPQRTTPVLAEEGD